MYAYKLMTCFAFMVCRCAYVCMYVCIICLFIYWSVFVMHVYSCMCLCIYLCNACVCMHVFMYFLFMSCMYMYVCMYVCIYLCNGCVFTRVNRWYACFDSLWYIHTYIHKYIHTYTCMCLLWQPPMLSTWYEFCIRMCGSAYVCMWGITQRL
jgi:hypothetical protein